MFNNKASFASIFFFVLLSFFSCKKKENTGWDTEWLIPLANDQLYIQDLIPDSLLGSDESLLAFNYSEKLYELNLTEQLANIPDTTLVSRFTIDSLKLPITSLKEVVSLGRLARQLQMSSDAQEQFLGNFIINNHGNTTIIPPINNISSQLYNIDLANFFQSALLSSGDLSIKIINNFPIDIENVAFQIQNASDLSVVIQDQVPIIPKNDSVSRHYDLSGKYIEGTALMNLLNLDSDGSNANQVLIDTTDDLTLSLELKNVRAIEAIARFPSQELLNITDDLTLNLAQEELIYAEIESGEIEVTVISTVQEAIELNFGLANAYDANGNTLSSTALVNPAPTTGASTITKRFNLDGYSIGLTGKNGNKFNTYSQTLIASIDSSGVLREITQDDSLVIRYTIKDIVPKYVKGYFGMHSLDIGPDTSSFSLFDRIEGQAIPEKMELDLELRNGIGVEGNVILNSFSAFKENTELAFISLFMGFPLRIDEALDFPLRQGITHFIFDEQNSNVNQLLGIFPNLLSFSGTVNINPNGNDFSYQNFIYSDSKLEVYLNLNIPLSIDARNITFKDTLALNLTQDFKSPEEIEDLTINLLSENGYPLSLILQLLSLDSNYQVLDTLFADLFIEAATHSDDCNSTINTESVAQQNLNTKAIENLKHAKHIGLAFTIDKTADTHCGNYVQIKEDQFLNLGLGARIKYKLDPTF